MNIYIYIAMWLYIVYFIVLLYDMFINMIKHMIVYSLYLHWQHIKPIESGTRNTVESLEGQSWPIASRAQSKSPEPLRRPRRFAARTSKGGVGRMKFSQTIRRLEHPDEPMFEHTSPLQMLCYTCFPYFYTILHPMSQTAFFWSNPLLQPSALGRIGIGATLGPVANERLPRVHQNKQRQQKNLSQALVVMEETLDLSS